MNSEPGHKTYADLLRDYTTGYTIETGRMSYLRTLKDKRKRRTVAGKHKIVHNIETAEVIRNEIYVLRSLGRHRNVIEFLASYDTHYETVIVTNFYDGGTLEQRINGSNEPLNEPQIIRYTRQICAGLKYLHSIRVVHGGINPRKILFQNEEHIRIIGFSKSTHLDRPYNVNTNINNSSSDFLSPEVRNGNTATYADDMWSLGILVYWMNSNWYPNFDEDYHFEYNDLFFCEISRNARYFIDCLLYPDPQLRITSNLALKHVWLKRPRTLRSIE